MDDEWSIIFLISVVLGLLPAPSSAQNADAHRETASPDTTNPGYLKVETRLGIDSLYVVVDKNFDDPYFIANEDSVALSTGEKFFTVVSKRSPDFSFSATIQPGTTKTVRANVSEVQDRNSYLEKSSYPVLSRGTNLLVITDRDSRVLVDSVARGTGIVQLDVSEGTHLVQTIHPEAGRTERVVTVQAAPPRLERLVAYNKPSQRVVHVRSSLPGLAQLHKDHQIKGLALLVGFGLTTVATAQQHFVFRSRNQEFESTREEYRSADREENVFRLGNEVERLHDAAQGAYRRRNFLAGMTAGLYLYSILDAWLVRPDEGYRTPLSNRTRVEPLFGAQKRGFRLVVRF